jgi:hypothetical protein
MEEKFNTLQSGSSGVDSILLFEFPNYGTTVKTTRSFTALQHLKEAILIKAMACLLKK